MSRVAADKELPFILKAPNANSRAAMAEANQIIKDRRARFVMGDPLLNDPREVKGK